MKGHRPNPQAKTWKRLALLCQTEGQMTLGQAAHKLELGEKEAKEFILKAFPQGLGMKLHQEGEEWFVCVETEALQYILPLNASEWIELQQILLSVDKHKKASAIFRSLKRKVAQISPVKMMKEMGKLMDKWDHEAIEAENETTLLLDKAIQDGSMVHFSVESGKGFNVYPCRVLHLEGKMSLIAEDNVDHCLSVVQVKDILGAKILKNDQQQKMTPFEIEEFIAALRSMNEKETRLVLKIHNPESVNLFPDHHFLGKPCMITNSNGDLIWAAYVEPCADLFEWLMTLSNNVEILDPIRFKQEYLSYCEGKLRKIA